VSDAVARQRPQREQRFERRMSDAEALMWNVEKDPWLNPSGGTLMLLDRTLDIDHFRAQIAATVAEIPRLRERVAPGIGRFSPPVWRPDPEFDLEYHVRPVALPAPGDERQLLDFVATLYQDPYDRTRPLWVFYAIEGLEFDRGALVWKIHHTVADGIGAGRIAEAFLQPARKAPEPPSVDLEAVVARAVEADRAEHGGDSLLDAVRDSVTHTMRRQAGIARRALGEVAMLGADPLRARDATQGIVRSVRQVTSQFGSGSVPSQPADEGATTPEHEGSKGSPLWKSRSRHRRLDLLSFVLEEALASAKGLGGTLNDWFVTGAVNGSIRYHDARGIELASLNTSFVVSTRTDRDIGGNAFTPTRISVPAYAMDPGDRFRAIQEIMREKRSGVSGGGALAGLSGIANLLPTSLVTGLARSQSARMDFATSNLRGGRSTFYVSGARIDGNYPFGPLAGTAFNLTTMSYAGRLDMGLFIDPVAVADPTELRDDIEAAYRQLIDLGTG
jgi:WS/DGAT/MGAT family acyltransferase